MTDREPTLVQADRIRAAFESRQISRDEAITQIIAAHNGGVTELGAAELLDHPVWPSQRFTASAGSGKSRHTWDMLRDCH